MNYKLSGSDFALPVQTVTIVPSTNYDKAISAYEFNRRVEDTRRFLSNTFGGYTSVRSVGGYVAKGGALITENASAVTSYATVESFKKNKGKWLSWCRNKKKEWKQENIGVIVENDMYYL